MKTFILRLEGGARVLLGLVALLGVSGCATTRTAHYGPLAGDHMLVTLVVSEDREVVARECEGVRASGVVLGCQMSWPIALPDGTRLRSMKIVRYTDALPSPLAFELDIHELCHTIAVLQLLTDPCHEGNGGGESASDRGRQRPQAFVIPRSIER